MAHTHMPRPTGLPDPDYRAEMYRDVPTKRLFAWVIDVFLISVIVAILTLFTAFTALLFLPFLYGITSFLYRWGTIAARSATPGMRFMAMELRTAEGERLSGSTAFLHTAGYFISFVTFPLQIVSMGMMLLTERNQGLSDALLGTVALNKRTD